MVAAFPGGGIISDVGIFNNEASLPEQGRKWQFVKLLSTGTYWYWNGSQWLDTGVSYSASAGSSADLGYFNTVANLPISPTKGQYAKVVDNGNGESTIFFYSGTVRTDTWVKRNEGAEGELIEMYLWGMYKAIGNVDTSNRMIVNVVQPTAANLNANVSQATAANLNMTATLAAGQTLATLTNVVNFGNIPANIIFTHLSIANFNALANNMSFY